jgi:Uma2 family endonuclease
LHWIWRSNFSCFIGLNAQQAPPLTGRAIVSIQGPVRLDLYSEPEPDIAVLRHRDDFYVSQLPGPADTHLIIEVADTSLLKDRRIKLPLYAAAGIAEVWIVDLICNAVEVYRDPRGNAYALSARLTEGDVTPLAFPDVAFDVHTLLPGTL